MWEILGRLFVWGTVTRDQDSDGHVQADVGDPKPIERVVQVATPGVYGVAKAGVKGIFLRLLDGAWSLGADTKPPSDAVAGECGLYDGTAVARITPTLHTFEVKGTAAASGIKLGSDGVMLTVVRNTDPVAAEGCYMGLCQATTVKVVAS